MTTTLPNVPDISPATSRPAPPSVDRLKIYYENGKGFLVGIDDNYISMNTTDLRRHLAVAGFQTRANGGAVSEVELVIHKIQTTKCVAYAGPLAGKFPGVHTFGGNKILVTGAPNIIEPDDSVDWPILREILDQMLEPEDPVQKVYFLGWLKHAYVSLKAGQISQGQALALAGPRNCGKSLLQQVIREVLGGREANPYAYMTGRTDFNRDLFGAENLMFGDEVASTDYRNRVKFGAYIKQFVVNATQRCHGKGREAVALDPFWRVTMSLNDEVSALEVLPPLGQESLGDKIMLLKTRRPAVFDGDTWRRFSRPENWQRLVTELPGFVAFLSAYEIPSELQDDRLGIKAYQNQDLMVSLKAESPVRRLLEIIDTEQPYHTGISFAVLPPVKNTAGGVIKPWRGTANQMETRLIRNEFTEHSARRLLHYPSACGQYMSELVKLHPNRVKDAGIRDGLKYYEVYPPQSESKPTAL